MEHLSNPNFWLGLWMFLRGLVHLIVRLATDPGFWQCIITWGAIGWAIEKVLEGLWRGIVGKKKDDDQPPMPPMMPPPWAYYPPPQGWQPPEPPAK